MRPLLLFLRSSLAFAFLIIASAGASAQSLDAFILVDAETNEDLRELSDGAVINLATDGSALSIRASTNGSPGSVRFTLSGAESDIQTESVAPYALKGDSSGNFASWTPSLGSYGLTVEIFGGGSASGELLETGSLAFSVVNQADTTPRILTVNSGSGSGSYSPGTQVAVSADDAGSGQVFTQWVGDTGGLAAVFAATTTFTMPAADASITATYGEAPVAGEVVIGGSPMQWHAVVLDLTGPASSETADPNPFLDFRFDIVFTGPGGQNYRVPGYFAGDGSGGASGQIWRAHLNPDEVGTWTYAISFRQGADIAVDLDPNAGVALSSYDGLNGSFEVTASDKSGNDFRAPDKGMLVNRGHHYLTYGGSGRPFLYTGPGIPENILGYRGFHNTTVGVGHEFQVHEADWNAGDPDWNSNDGRNLNGRGFIGAINYIADQGANSLYMMSNTIGGDGKDVFPHPTPNTTKDRYDLLKLEQWNTALSHAQSKGIFLHWHLAEHETGNNTYYGGEGVNNQNVTNTMTVERKLYFRMLNAMFGHYNGLKWNIMEETEFSTADRSAQMAYIHAIDPYDHPVTYQVGGIGIAFNTYDNHLGDANIDAGSFQGSNSRASMFDEMQKWRSKSAAAGEPWTVAWDEPQKIENDNNDAVNGYPMGRRDKMWPCLMGGGDGFMWYIQQDGGGHGFDQRIEDFTIMQNAFHWSKYARDFLGTLPLLEMNSSMSIVSSNSGNDYTLSKPGEVYAIFNDRSGRGMTLDLSGVSGEFTVRWFDPRNGGALQNGTVTSVIGGGSVSLGSAPNSTGSDWAVLVEATRQVAYIYGDIAANGTQPSGSAPPYDQMLLTDTGATGLSDFKALVEGEGFAITQYYDQVTDLDAAFLNQFEVVIFGLHQKIWSASEKAALDAWLRGGGGMLIYSDSASGGRFNLVGAQNSVGQSVVNNLIADYGMEVTVDQAAGTTAYRAGPGAIHPITLGRLILEGEGVSPIAVDPASNAERLIPYENTSDYKVSGNTSLQHLENLTITNPLFAALALAPVGSGNVIALFDRQPMWNDGPGSDIEKRDNTEILRRTIVFLAGNPGAPLPSGPQADINASPLTGDKPLQVQFDASGSTPGEGATLAAYSWDFENDGIADATGVMVSHTYTTVGQFTASLTVTDSFGDTANTSTNISVVGQDPFGNGGQPWPLPGRIEAENFDLGGPGIAYFDQDATNQGGDFRMDEEVDVEVADDVDGVYNIGYLDPGEWLEYTVEINESGSYLASFRVASQSAGGSIRLLVDGVDLTGEVALSATDGWQNYMTVSSPVFSLTPGKAIVRVEIVSGAFNLNWFSLNRDLKTFSDYLSQYPSLTGPDALPEADPDGDSLANIVEQWLAFDPTRPESTGLPRFAQVNGEQVFIFNYDSRVIGSSLFVQTSDDLVSWASQTLDPAWITDNGDLRQVVIPVAPADHQEFRRLRLTTE